jgi:uncharacterized membrane protein
MTRTLFHSLTILMLGLFATQGRLLTAQCPNGVGQIDPLALRQERRRELAPAISRARSSQIPEPDRDAAALGPAKTKIYQFRSIDYLGAASSQVYDFNGKTEVGAAVVQGIDPSSAFTFQNDSYAPLIVPGAVQSVATGINPSGTEIVGCYEDRDGNYGGFLYAYNGGVYTNIDYPGGTYTEPWAINDGGLIVGVYIDPNGGTYHGFLYDKGTFTAINVPNAPYTLTHGINSSGSIVGTYLDGDEKGIHGFLYNNGSYSTFDFPTALLTVATGINDAGAIAGYYLDHQSEIHGFTYIGGVFTQVDVHGALDTVIYRINNKNNVVGFLVDGKAQLHGIVGK